MRFSAANIIAIVSLLLIGSFSIPAYACGKSMEKKEMKCCMKSDSKSGHSDQKCCCSSESASEHSDNQNHDDGCGDNCPDSSCHCSSINHIAGIYLLTEELIETEISISFTTQFPEVNSSPKAAFISFWQPPKIG